MELPPNVQIRFTVYFYCIVLTLEYAAECIIYMLAKQWINQKVVKAVLFGRNNEGIVPQRTNLGAFVLLHELYPAKEASAAVPVDRAESLSTQDFIMALQKIDLEGVLTGSNADEASFIFQTNQLPLSCFTGEARCKPGPSCSDASANQDMDDSDLPIFGPHNRTPSTPVFSPMISESVWLESDKSDFVDVLVSDRTTDDTAFQSAPEMSSDPRGASVVPLICETYQISTEFPESHAKQNVLTERDGKSTSVQAIEMMQMLNGTGSSASGVETGPLDVPNIGTNSLESINLDAESESVISSSFVRTNQWHPSHLSKRFSPSSSDGEVDEDADQQQLIDSHQCQRSLVDFLPPRRSSNDAVAPSPGIVRSSSVSHTGRLALTNLGDSSSRPVTDQLSPTMPQRTSRRKSALHPLSQDIGGRASRSTSHSSLSDSDRYTTLQEGCSSDSELDYRMDGGRYFRARGRASGALKLEHPSSASLSSVLPSSPIQSGFTRSRHADYPITSSVSSLAVEDQKIEKVCSPSTARPLSTRHFDLLDTSDGGSSFRSFPSASSASSTSRRLERHLRDVDQLELAKVPFTYEQVVYCSNEEFKELRSMPNLTSYQIGAMLDARRRATNRQAAERCRRLKTALRDELSDRLVELRLQRELLTKKLVRARQRKQEAKSMLITEQKRILSMLRGPDGDNLNYGDWRVRLTSEDEVVVVAVGR